MYLILVMHIIFLSEKAHPKSFGSVMARLLNEDKDVARVLDTISHVAEHGGHPSPPYALPLRNADGNLNEIRCTLNQDELMRVYYFVDREEVKMVLMNATIKPNGITHPAKYQGKAGKKLSKEIQNDIQEAINIKAKYLTSPNDYEPLCF